MLTAKINMNDKATGEYVGIYRKAVFNPELHDLVIYFEDEDEEINVSKSVYGEHHNDVTYMLEAALQFIQTAREVADDDETDCRCSLYQFLQLAKHNNELYDFDFATDNNFYEVDSLEEWAEEYCIDCGYFDSKIPGLIRDNIDWKGVADDLLQYDYSEIKADNGNYIIWNAL